MRNKIIILIFVLIILPNFVSAFLISDQGTNVREVVTGNLTELANLTVSVYDNLTGGNLIFEQNFSDAIVNTENQPIDKVVLLFSDGTFTDFKRK